MTHEMWIAESTVQKLDRPETRAELAEIATACVRDIVPESDIEIFWDEGWVRRVGDVYFPDPDIWHVPANKAAKWGETTAKYLRDVADYWFHVYTPRPGDVIVDIGAGRGEDVYGFSKAVGSSGHVWAIEPHPVSFSVLTRFCSMNGIMNVTPIQVACMDEPAELQIETLPVWESNYVRAGDRSATSSPVQGVVFDQLASEWGIPDPDFLKMNIEGAERAALPGCRRTLDRTRFATIAAHDFRADRGEGEQFRTLGFVTDFLKRASFEVVTRDKDPRYYVPYHVHGRRTR